MKKEAKTSVKFRTVLVAPSLAHPPRHCEPAKPARQSIFFIDPTKKRWIATPRLRAARDDGTGWIMAQNHKSFLVLRVPMTGGEAAPSESGRAERFKKELLP